MAYSYDFKDNVVYGADDINAIRASLMTKGVVEETIDSCKVVLSENGVTVTEGQAIFGDGCRIEVDNDGVELEITAGETNYIYFNNNTLAGICEVVAATTAPEGDYVLLAEIDADGNLTDKREFAQLKTAETERYAASFMAEFQLDGTKQPGDVITEIDLPKSNCSYIEFYLQWNGQATPWIVRLFPKENCLVQWYCVNAVGYGSGYSFSLGWYSKYWEIKYEVIGNKLILKLVSVNAEDASYTVSISGVCIR